MIVKLSIPKGALVFCNATNVKNDVAVRKKMFGTLKMRAEKAKVLSVTYIDGSKVKGKFITSPSYTGGRHLDYVVGKIVRPHEFSTVQDQCAGGIHFFTSRKSAVVYI